MKMLVGLGLSLVAMVAGLSTASATDIKDVHLVLRNHQFEPSQLRLSSGQKYRLIIRNEDDAAEEFESYDLNRSKFIPAGRQANVYVGPLSAGTYTFVGELHEDTATGSIIAE